MEAPMKKRMTLKDLKVNSFVTIDGIRAVGGSCDCSLQTGRICDKACSDACPSDNCTANC